MIGIVSAAHPPAFDGVFGNVNYWERSKDPWHRDAFPTKLKDAAPNQQSTRTSGWMAIDWIENPMGYISDGHTCELAIDFIIKSGPYGRPAAYRNADETAN